MDVGRYWQVGMLADAAEDFEPRLHPDASEAAEACTVGFVEGCLEDEVSDSSRVIFPRAARRERESKSSLSITQGPAMTSSGL